MQNNDRDLDAGSTDTASKPHVDEAGSVNISGYVRVFDPNTDETLVESRE